MNRDMFARCPLFAIICLGCMGLVSPLSNAQSTYGSIMGTITDTTGGSLADVDVTLVSRETGSKLTDKKGIEGNYKFKNLIPAPYGVPAEKGGFKRWEQRDFVLKVQKTSGITLTMQLGKISQTV